MIPGPKLNITSNKMSKKMITKISLLPTFGVYSEVSSFVFWHFYIFLFKDGCYNFPVFKKPSDESIQTWVMQLLSTEFF